MNLFDPGPPPPPGEERVQILEQGEGFRIEMIVSNGAASPEGFWYDQEQREVVFLLAGSAVLEFSDGRTVPLSPGQRLSIAPRERHRVAFTSQDPPCVWLCFFAD